MPGRRRRAVSTRAARIAGGLAALLLAAALQFVACTPAAAGGGTAACVCYCGIRLSPPCGDDACKRACGWKEPTTGGGSPAGGGANAMGTAIGNAISSGITQGLELARFRAEQERQQQQRALEQNRQMLRAVDAMSREQTRQGEEMDRQAAEREKRLDDRRREEALSGLTGIPQSGELTLKPATDFFGVPGNPTGNVPPPPDPSVVDLRHLDPNKPITVDNAVLRDPARNAAKEKPVLAPVECEKRRAARDRIAAGLPVQEEAIRRTEAQLAASEKGVTEAGAEKRQVLLEGAIQEAKGYAADVLTSANALRSQVAMLREMQIDKAKRDLLIRSLDTVIFDGEDLARAAQAGREGGEALRGKVDKLSRQLLPLADKLLLQSGIAEKAGEELSEKLGGPLGALAFRGARLSIDFTVAVGKGKISARDREVARKNLDTMRGQLRRANARLAELDRELADGCAAGTRAAIAP